MKMYQFFKVLSILSFLSHPVLTHAQGTAFSFQGRLAEGTNAASGNYDLKFTLLDSHTNATQVGEIIATNSVPVNNGVFTVILDFGSSAFTGLPRWLQIDVRTNDSLAEYTTLLPRQRLWPTPYSVHAANAALLDGLGTNQFAPAIGSSNYVDRNGDTMTGTLNLPANGLAVANAQLVTSAGNVGIGTTAPNEPLEVAVPVTGGRLIVSDGAGAERRVLLFNSPAPSSPDYASLFAYKYGTAASGLNLALNEWGGNVGIGTTIPATKLQIVGPDATVETAWKSEFFSGYAGNYLSQRVGFGYDASGTTFGAAIMTAGTTRLWVGNNGNVGIGITAPHDKLHVEGSIRAHRITFKGTGGNSGLEPDYYAIYQESGPFVDPYPDLRIQYHTGIKYDAYAGYGGHQFYTDYDGTGNPAGLQMQITDKIYIAGNVGIGTTSPQAKLHVVGEMRTSVLAITGGADLAEPFLMSKDLAKGSVVVIDDERPGRLKLSDQPYDTRVAGIISGANGINTGLSLSQQGVMEDGQNVALTGRVYALADATDSPIKPGDLLTTSSNPGHCMKATDRARAPGAVLGKAMSSLKEGKGLVLVLVSLQ